MARGLAVRLERGTVVLVDLDPTIGHEQKNVRPCVIVSDPFIAADQRYALVGVVPPQRRSVAPRIAASTSGA